MQLHPIDFNKNEDLAYLTSEVCRIARQTGVYLANERKNFTPDKVLEKHSHDYVSYVDREAEKMTVKALANLLPEAGFITEEGTIEQSSEGLNWIIDPLDGTTNFIHDYAPYCVSIALRKEKELLIGVVYEVCRDECFYAWKGGKSYLNGKEIHVSKKRMDNAFIGLELPYEAEAYKPAAKNVLDKLYGKVASLRVSGSAAMDLCFVACGRYDGWGEAFIKVWDYAAGVLIVREAGGQVTDFKGREGITGTHHIIASNKIIHDELKEVLDIIDL